MFGERRRSRRNGQLNKTTPNPPAAAASPQTRAEEVRLRQNVVTPSAAAPASLTLEGCLLQLVPCLSSLLVNTRFGRPQTDTIATCFRQVILWNSSNSRPPAFAQAPEALTMMLHHGAQAWLTATTATPPTTLCLKTVPGIGK